MQQHSRFLWTWILLLFPANTFKWVAVHLVVHKPTGIVVKCQQERSQLQNKALAMQMLASKLLAIKQAEHEAKLAGLKGEAMDVNFGSQIRSYVFHPYKMVKDHRTNYSEGNVDAVMNGEIDGFIEAYLRMKA